MQDRPALLEGLARIAREAGERVMAIYTGAAPVGATTKADGTPLTAADLAAEAAIAAGLTALCPELPVVSEESAERAAARPPGPRFLLVDPLDGTREFLGRTGEFTVNIALVEEGRPTLGVVLAPVPARLWLGDVLAGRAERREGGAAPGRPIRVRPVPAAGLVAVASRSHRDAETDAFLARLPIAACRSIGSALKFCLVAEGEADVYPRFGPTMEWDTAAGHAVLAAAGGRVVTPDGAELRYGKYAAGFRNGPFIAWGGGAAPAVQGAPTM
ncbi:3'(2'),5'-bisphosphate nucleotidase CysQ [Caldovatus aquaticus]|uniref:3'(2'),5'-bisphosphate nucleotidase CysQ n=1 Tax=Caldovatus aquaticus TaxID=2865671 RepID=A0ABS7F503_9PROT|nr:3'(2'),5'-bisphosphate nucleotidase CysQ [Caldovatus aquaticus]MBW8270699.1 3'(2'),5'-bisphosphate nucleotidase CysQ [Caldovatus aquaticus]